MRQRTQNCGGVRSRAWLMQGVTESITSFRTGCRSNLALSRLLDSSSRRSKRRRSMWKDVVEPSEQICWRLSFPVNTDNSDNASSNPTYWLSYLDEISDTDWILLTNALLE
ncbi:hypothetical protein GJ496_003823 [Pomphorhynchus laevis]|nr:hypothetical protein GJ496_003823 [Pomphorhynchus laevis]